MTPFFITGYPRSRTAWLANYFSCGNTFCFHDGWKKWKTAREMRQEMESVGAENVGNSDAANLIHLEELRSEFPEAKCLLVLRDRKDVEKSMIQIGWEKTDVLNCLTPIIGQLLETGPEWLLTVEFSALGKDLLILQPISQMLAPGFHSGAERDALLGGLNVQIHTANLGEEIRQSAAGILRSSEVPSEMTQVQQEYWETIRAICANQPAAYEWFVTAAQIGDVWDHIEDGDVVHPMVAARAFTSAVVDWPVNEFLRVYGVALTPVLMNAISAWRYSNQDGASKEKAYDFYTEVPCALAYLLGGKAAVERYSDSLRRLSRAMMMEDELKDHGRR